MAERFLEQAYRGEKSPRRRRPTSRKLVLALVGPGRFEVPNWHLKRSRQIDQPRKSSMVRRASLIPAERIERAILLIRGQKVMLDEDLARLYVVKTKALNQAVKRNMERFPNDFAFQLTKEEWKTLRSQFVTSNDRGGRRYPPYVFTEQGVAMLSSVLRSRRAVLVNVEIMRAFVRLRRIIASHKVLATKLSAMERKYDQQFKVVFDIIRELMTPRVPKDKGRIGFR
jgi:hypothetical protein